MEAVLEPRHNVIVCGAGSSEPVIAGRLAENPDVKALLREAGGADDVARVTEASPWPLNLGGERDWSFASESDPRLHGRSIPFSMGKVLGVAPRVVIGERAAQFIRAEHRFFSRVPDGSGD